MNKINPYLLICSICIASGIGWSHEARCQNTDEIDFQLWGNYALTIPVTDNFSYGGDVGIRGLISNEEWNQVLIRPTATYRFNQKFAVAGAMAWFGTFNIEESNVNEFRLHQDFNASWPDFGYVEMFYRVRIEERWFFYETMPNEFNIRTRYLIGAESADLTFLGHKRPIYFQVIFEGFKTLGSESASELFINQTRGHVAFGHRLTEKVRYELHYIIQKSRQFEDTGLRTSQNIFRIRWYHRL